MYFLLIFIIDCNLQGRKSMTLCAFFRQDKKMPPNPLHLFEITMISLEQHNRHICSKLLRFHILDIHEFI